MTRPVALLALLPLLACTVLAEDALEDDAGDGVVETAGGGALGAAGAGAGTAGPGSGAGGSGGTAGLACGEAPSAVAPCPDNGICNGGCEAGICLIRCVGVDACKDAMIVCPPGLHCEIACSGKASCKASTSSCPPEHRCRLSCDGDDACVDATVLGAAGPLEVVCGDEKSPCDELSVDCGVGSCDISCPGGGPNPQVSCGPACQCNDCRDSDD